MAPHAALTLWGRLGGAPTLRPTTRLDHLRATQFPAASIMSSAPPLAPASTQAEAIMPLEVRLGVALACRELPAESALPDRIGRGRAQATRLSHALTHAAAMQGPTTLHPTMAASPSRRPKPLQPANAAQQPPQGQQGGSPPGLPSKRKLF